MKPQQIGQAYNQITHLWESERFNMNNGIEQHKKAIAFVDARGKALDIGCGCTGRFIELLSHEGFTPTGLDVSTEMLKIAQSAILIPTLFWRIFANIPCLKSMTSLQHGTAFGISRSRSNAQCSPKLLRV